jgi:ferritin-like metal-binding protein YciE
MSLDSLEAAFYDELRDVFDAEKQLVKALPKVAEAASSDALKKAILAHLKETKIHVQRAEEAFTETGKAARAKKCEAMAGLVEETEKMLEERASRKSSTPSLLAARKRSSITRLQRTARFVLGQNYLATKTRRSCWARILVKKNRPTRN